MGTITESGKHAARGVFEPGPWLLGIDWCMIPSWEPVCDKSGREHPGEWRVPANTGMMGVVPAWRLHSLFLEDERVVQCTREMEAQELARQAVNLPSVMPTSSESEPAITADNPSHEEDFNRLLTSAVTRKLSDDQT